MIVLSIIKKEKKWVSCLFVLCIWSNIANRLVQTNQKKATFIDRNLYQILFTITLDVWCAATFLLIKKSQHHNIWCMHATLSWHCSPSPTYFFFLLYKGGEHARSVNYHLVFGHATKFYTVFSLATHLSPPARRSRATLAGDRLDCWLTHLFDHLITNNLTDRPLGSFGKHLTCHHHHHHHHQNLNADIYRSVSTIVNVYFTCLDVSVCLLISCLFKLEFTSHIFVAIVIVRVA